MPDSINPGARTVQDFIAARRQAAQEMLLARFTGQSTELLSYEDVRAKLRAIESSGQVLREIPLDAIVGSVGRYSDFTRSFLPKRDADRQRWSQVKAVAEGMTGFPPIEVYQIGEAYFVRDGNHRVSVSRQSGASHIQAYVTIVRSDVPLEPDVQPDDLIVKAEYADFLIQTNLRSLRPEAGIPLTVPGQYRKLLEHIEVHRYFMGLALQREIPYSEAVTDWYDRVYLPMVNAIQAREILSDFPERTVSDLYLWVSEHRHLLQERLDVDIPPSEAAADLAAQFSPRPQRIAARLGARLYDLFTPDELEGGPKPGHWRRERLETRTDSNQIFPEILVPLGDQPDQWDSLEQAIILAEKEGSHLHGLHVTAAETADFNKIQPLRSAFLERCAQYGLGGSFHHDTGKIARLICHRARWMDLVVLSLKHPPQPGLARRFTSGFRTILHRCSRPVLSISGVPKHLRSALVAYDGSPKAREALYLAGYLSSRWEISLQVLYVQTGKRSSELILDQAREHLRENRNVEFLLQSGNAEEEILAMAQANGVSLILMGGYTARPWMEALRGSTVERLLRSSTIPLMICR